MATPRSCLKVLNASGAQVAAHHYDGRLQFGERSEIAALKCLIPVSALNLVKIFEMDWNAIEGTAAGRTCIWDSCLVAHPLVGQSHRDEAGGILSERKKVESSFYFDKKVALLQVSK
jgi:hypothetical protein